MSFVVRFVDEKSVIREEFLGFLECGDGTTGIALSNLILEELKKLDLDIMNCRGQGYDGAGNMSGEYNGCAAKISAVNKLALYCHCQAHCLSLCVCASCKLPAITSMMELARYVYYFFELSPKRNKLFDEVKITFVFCLQSVNNEVKKVIT